MYLNSNRFKHKLWFILLGISVALFLISLTQEYLESSQLFVFASIFLGYILINATYARTIGSGFQKFLLSIGVIILAGVFASLMLWGFCYANKVSLCTPRPFEVTVVVYFVLLFMALILYLAAMFFGKLSKKKYHA
jgi:hypothetical protein